MRLSVTLKFLELRAIEINPILILTAERMENVIFYDVTPCTPVELHRRFGGTHFLEHMERKLRQARNRRQTEPLLI
jgi:hypothetical protein